MCTNEKKYKLLCIVCPEGCEIEAKEIDGTLEFQEGICKRGQEYARQEIYNPSRYLTTTVRLNGANQSMLPVKTAKPIPKAKLIEAMREIAKLEVSAPVKLGEIICEDVANTGIALIASKSVSLANEEQMLE